MLQLLATIIEAIFMVCGHTMIEYHQCSLPIKKWNELVIDTVQAILGLTVDTNKMKVGITSEYCNQVLDLLTNSWPDTRCIFKVGDVQKLVGKVAHLGKGTQLIYKITSHLYSSLAFVLKQNELFLHKCLPKFCEIIGKIERNQCTGDQQEFAKELNFALKTASKMINSHTQVYIINETMHEELKFIWQALHDNSKITFKVPIAFIILRTPSALFF
jgi:hypothetical protein